MTTVFGVIVFKMSRGIQSFTANINSGTLSETKTKMTSLLKRLSFGVLGRCNYSALRNNNNNTTGQVAVRSCGRKVLTQTKVPTIQERQHQWQQYTLQR